VIDDDDDDGEGAEKIEARLAFPVAKARIDSQPRWRGSFGD
jgi:hypothetical protein